MATFPDFKFTLSEEHEKLVRKLNKLTATVIKQYELIQPGDKVMVCLSGGKDSYTMLDLLLSFQRRAPFAFSIVAVNLDQKQPDFPAHILPEYLTQMGVDFKVVERDTYTIVKEKVEAGKTMCSLCSRLRRGILYTVAKEIGATKIALGHHREDVIETFFLNLFFGGKLEAMPPKFLADSGENTVIRPLSFCPEADIAAYALLREFPIIPCNLCGSQPNMQRKIIKSMLKEWEKSYPDRTETILTALQHLHPSHLLDKELFDFKNLTGLTEMVQDNEEFLT